MPIEPTLIVSERFFSLQGESTHAGLPCVFIRLSGCNLRCRYCDAAYSYEEAGTAYPLSSLLAFVDGFPHALVEVTGGEPLLQAGTIALLQSLVDKGRTVLLETNGTLDLTPVPAGVITIMDVKCPDSGMAEAIRLENLALLRPRDEIKFVLSSPADYQWALAFIRDHQLIDPATGQASHPLLFSPVTGRLLPADLAGWMIREMLPIRLQLQLHKLLWPGTERGV